MTRSEATKTRPMGSTGLLLFGEAIVIELPILLTQSSEKGNGVMSNLGLNDHQVWNSEFLKVGGKFMISGECEVLFSDANPDIAALFELRSIGFCNRPRTLGLEVFHFASIDRL
jgi:hypothetical protein